MTPDVDIKDYYLRFIHEAKSDIVTYNEKLSLSRDIKEQAFAAIAENKEFYKEFYGIDLDTYETEYKEKVYNSKATLYNKVLRLANAEENSEHRVKLLQVVKYCNVLSKINEYQELIKLANIRKDLHFRGYKKIVFDYYNKVHQCVLEGMGYVFNYGIGTFCINRWLMDKKAMAKRTKLDFHATAVRKKQLLAEGKKLYNENEAAWYKARNIPYDGIDYRVFKTTDHFYDITFINSKLFTNSSMIFKHSNTIGKKFRGMTHADMSDSCLTINDIYVFKGDIRVKLNMLLHKDPSKYLNFIRNAEQDRYQLGAHNRKD